MRLVWEENPRERDSLSNDRINAGSYGKWLSCTSSIPWRREELEVRLCDGAGVVIVQRHVRGGLGQRHWAATQGHASGVGTRADRSRVGALLENPVVCPLRETKNGTAEGKDSHTKGVCSHSGWVRAGSSLNGSGEAERSVSVMVPLSNTSSSGSGERGTAGLGDDGSAIGPWRKVSDVVRARGRTEEDCASDQLSALM